MERYRMKKIENTKNAIYINTKYLSEEELKHVADYLTDLELEEAAVVREFSDLIVVKVSRYATVTIEDVYVDLIKLVT